jgi:hypothetical protein
VAQRPINDCMASVETEVMDRGNREWRCERSETIAEDNHYREWSNSMARSREPL